jgi:hypothetical protein
MVAGFPVSSARKRDALLNASFLDTVAGLRACRMFVKRSTPVLSLPELLAAAASTAFHARF